MKALRQYILVFHKPSKRWVGYFKAPGVVTQICVSKFSVYLGLQFSDYPVLEIDKRSVLSTPKDCWVALPSVGRVD